MLLGISSLNLCKNQLSNGNGAAFYTDFTSGNNTLDPRITFSRASNATVTGSNGLIQYAPHNLLTYSEQLDNSSWAKTRSTVTANTVVAPDGTTTADAIIEDSTATSTHFVRELVTGVSGVTYTISLFLKANTRTWALVTIAGGSGYYFDVGTGAVGSSFSGTGTVSNPFCTSVGNGWYRCGFTIVAGNTNNGIDVYLATGNNVVSYTGNGTSGLYLWGAQLNVGSLQPYYSTTVKNLLGYSEAFDNAAWNKYTASFVQTNLLTYSEQLDNAAWNKFNSTVTANATTSPDGTVDADKLVEDTATTAHYAQNGFTPVNATTYTGSVYVKAAERGFAFVGFSGGSMATTFVSVNLSTGVITTATGTPLSSSSTAVGNGWYRVTISLTSTGTVASSLDIRLSTDGLWANRSYTGNGTSGIYVWGAQLVQGSVAGDYQQTTSAALPVQYQAPNGTFTADAIIETTAVAAAHRLQQAGTVTSGAPVTVSIYAKANGRTMFDLFDAFTSKGASFNLTTVTTAAPQTAGVTAATSASITDAGDGWYRCSITVTTTSTSASLSILLSDGTTTIYTGDSSKGIYIWGAQLSDSSSLDPYVNNPVAAPTAAAYYGARFDYDPVTLQPKGLLIEEQRTNLVLQSEAFDNASWVASGVTVSANTAVSPDGTQDADKVIPTAVSGSYKELQQNFSATSGTVYSFSQYVKADGYRYVQIIGNGAAFGTFAVNFDLQTGTETAFNAGTSTVGARSITSVGNGWYRISVSVTALATTTGRIGINIIPAADSVRGVTWTGNGTSGVLYWGAQLEASAFATSYIPTTASQVTRSADVALIQGSNFSGWYNQSEGTLLAETVTTNQNLGSNRYSVTMDNGTVANMIAMFVTTTLSVQGFVVDANVAQFQNQSTTTTASSTVKSSIAYKANDFIGCANSVLSTADTSGTVPSVNTMVLGNRSDSTRTLNGCIKKIAYYPRRLSSTELVALTS